MGATLLNSLKMNLIISITLFFSTVVIGEECTAPNIVFIIADDLGWNDVSFHGSDQIPTPNIDLLAYSGVALGRYYSHAICTPSRSALLSGKYSHTLGMQGVPLGMTEDRGIPLNVSLLPEYLREAGYKTHLVGKWHVGSSRMSFLPTNRGFDSHFGHRSGYMDYYDYTLVDSEKSGFSLYDNLTAAWNVEGYITDVYTSKAKSVIENHDTSSPLFLMLAHNAPHSGNDCALVQAPPEDVRTMRHVESSERRIFAAMVKKVDDSVGEVVQSLADKGILENTIIVFVSDNGGMTSGTHMNYASNYPLRGIKMTPFEGGVRVAGLIWSTSLQNTCNYWDGYMHVSDWMPTLLSAAGLEVPSDIDGQSQWDNINANGDSSRTVMYEIDDYTGYASITYCEYKLITGNVTKIAGSYQGGDLTGIIGEAPSYDDAITNSTMYSILSTLGLSYDISVRDNMNLNCSATATSCYPGNGTVCLYNIKDDPCETTDLSDANADLVTKLQNLLDTEAARRIPRVKPIPSDPLALPSLHNYTWAPWIEES